MDSSMHRPLHFRARSLLYPPKRRLNGPQIGFLMLYWRGKKIYAAAWHQTTDPSSSSQYPGHYSDQDTTAPWYITLSLHVIPRLPWDRTAMPSTTYRLIPKLIANHRLCSLWDTSWCPRNPPASSTQHSTAKSLYMDDITASYATRIEKQRIQRAVE